MADSHTAVGHILVDHFRYWRQSRDTVVDEEHLSATAHLEVDGIRYHLAGESGNLRLYGIAVGRRCAHDAHVPRPHEREL